MIELVIADRCTQCNSCVQVCPSNVFELVPGKPPAIARQSDCQTCFMCELYCAADALYVGPDCESAVAVDEAQIKASGLLGQFRRDSGWDEWSKDPQYRNQHWRMDHVFMRARDIAASPKLDAPTDKAGVSI
ncbi:ferredoxin family protein [Glaciimonas sp. PCH181]|uniref:4Fe-4S dicluster domain-containing protein n=1 Tax=Glaciimonas sp. PCH181 TaxID=2133943 RepID=UPI000D396455|nr:ferredoxin family protein [Glaciimonas sp. PCH181]PUA19662.1 ferredoxin [Glaciimonas sp. PCH181]